MKGFGSLLVFLGIAAILLDFFDRVPKLLVWIYMWGDGVAWIIKIAIIILGAILFFLGKKNESEKTVEEENDSAA